MTEEWVSITEAAAKLTAVGDAIERSALSRYLKQHAEALALRPSGKSNLVNYTALAAHRAENIRIRAMPPEIRPAASGPARTRFAGSLSDSAARKAQADAELKEMDLALRRRQLTPVAEVDRAARDAVALMQGAFERAIEMEAASLSLKHGWDERTARIALKSFTRRGMEVFNREILDRLEAMRRARDAGDRPGALHHTEAGALQ